MKLFRRWPALFALSLLLPGAAVVAQAGGHREGIERLIGGTDSYLFYSTNQEPDWHGVAMPRKAHMPVIHWYDKWNPVWWFGNNDDPVPPAWYEPGNPHRKRDWFFRNPLTNFTYFVMGVADKDTMRYGRYPKLVGNPHGGWNFAVTRRRVVLLPFMDYKNRHLEFYLGWRERGNFGAKLVFHHPPEELGK